MAKANLTLKNGTTVEIEGTADEVGILLDRFNGTAGFGGKGHAAAPAPAAKAKSSGRFRARNGPKPRILELIEEEFFKKPKGLGDLKLELEVRGHFYELNALSTPILRLVKDRTLRRIKDNGAWKYIDA